MKFKKYLVERGDYGSGISFIDIDETVFRTFAKILVKDKISGVVMRELDNMEFNSYKLQDNEEYDFRQFKDSKLFQKTSIPIQQTIKRIKRMVKGIQAKGSDSKIIFLTARSDFDNKFNVIDTFKQHGINMDPSIFHIERAGNLGGTIPAAKQKIMLKYLMKGIYRRARLIDDHKPNVNALLDLEKKYGDKIGNAVKKYYSLDDDEVPVKYYGLWVKPNGSLQRIK